MSNRATDLTGTKSLAGDCASHAELSVEPRRPEESKPAESGGIFGTFSPVHPNSDYLVRPRQTMASRGDPSTTALKSTKYSSKRVFDVAFSIVLLVVFLPLMALFCAAIRINSPGPAIFVQQRIGRDGISFPCLKFRTMVIDAKEQLEDLLRNDPVAKAEWDRDQKLRNDIRITAVGRFLRKTSLDELPQLLNILVGHMSVVGPRPIVALEVVRYGTYFKDYCAVRPGLTGLWQIGGRNDVTYDSRVKLDVEYVRNHSFAGDIAICCKTVPALLFARGCY